MSQTPSLFQDEIDLSPVRAALQKTLSSGASVIYWHDPERTFQACLGDIEIDELDVIDLTDQSKLSLKERLSRVPDRPYLLYVPGTEPSEADDLFLDVKGYARHFRADAASLKLGELGLAERLDLVGWVTNRKRFLASKDRLAKFKYLVDPADTISDLDRKALSVTCKSATAEPREILLTLFDSLINLDAEPTVWKDVDNFDLRETFWELARERFGVSEEVSTFRALMLRLFATDLFQTVRDRANLGSSVSSLRLFGRNEVAVFLSQWRDSNLRCASYARLSQEAATALQVAQAITSISPDGLATVETFQVVDQRILVGLRDEILKPLTESRQAEIDDLIQGRLSSHWSRQISGAPLAACYEALEESMTVFSLIAKFEKELPAIKSSELPQAYTQRWWQIDKAYRRFFVRVGAAIEGLVELLKPLAERVEEVYSNAYLSRLGVRWSEALDGGLLTDWKLPRIPRQDGFFKEQVEDALDNGPKRVYVIISDALRYEAGMELADQLRMFRLVPEILPMLSVLPSITALGMASLLPHTSLSISPSGQVAADGQSTTGIEARRALLAPHGGIAVRAEDLKSMKRDEGRALVKDARIVYIYHDVIDATGDKASSEGDTFEAVDTAIKELVSLVRRISDHFNGSTVIITADHGFLFTNSGPTEIDKSSLGKIDTAALQKKRYVVGKELPTSGAFHRASLSVTSHVEGDWEAIFPRSTQRFHLAGGAQYVHGGPMPHEVFVPLILVKEVEGDASKKTQKRPVGIVLATSTTRVTTNQQNWKFLQTERVDERLTSLRASVGIYDGLRPISEVKAVVFDSETDAMSDRERIVKLTLAAETFQRVRTYDLIVRNADDGTEVLRQPLTLDIAFTNEF